MLLGVRWYRVVLLLAFAIVWLAFGAGPVCERMGVSVQEAAASDVNPFEYGFREIAALLAGIGPALAAIGYLVCRAVQSRVLAGSQAASPSQSRGSH